MRSISAAKIIRELKAAGNADDAKFLQKFFKTGKGQYGEGDVFLGIRVPVLRAFAKKNPVPEFSEIEKLLASSLHEVRMVALLFLMKKFKAAGRDKLAGDAAQKAVFDFYSANASRANNWDLVDISCRDIVGEYLLTRPAAREILYRLAESKNLWEQRIAIVSTWTFIKHRQFDDTLRLAEIFLTHRHDLMHKATGWMLREVGKKNRAVLEKFLDRHRRAMPRTALRYAIEHFSPAERAAYLAPGAPTSASAPATFFAKAKTDFGRTTDTGKFRTRR